MDKQEGSKANGKRRAANNPWIAWHVACAGLIGLVAIALFQDIYRSILPSCAVAFALLAGAAVKLLRTEHRIWEWRWLRIPLACAALIGAIVVMGATVFVGWSDDFFLVEGVGGPAMIEIGSRNREWFGTTLSGGGRRISSVEERGASDSAVRIWNTEALPSLDEQGAAMGFKGRVRPILSADGSLLATVACGGDGELCLWSAESLERLSAVDQPGTEGAMCAAFSPDRQLLCVGFVDGVVRAFAVPGLRQTIRMRCDRRRVMTIAFLPNGTLCSGGADGSLRGWDLKTGRQLFVLKEHRNGVTSIAVSPDGSTAASASFDGSVRIWDVTSRKVRMRYTDPNWRIWQVRFSPDGKKLAAGGTRIRGGISLAMWRGAILDSYSMWDTITWDVASRRAVQRRSRLGDLRAMEFLSNTALLAVVADDDDKLYLVNEAVE